MNTFEIELDWVKLSNQRGLSCEFIETNIDKNWDWNAICRYSALTVDFIKRHPRVYNWNAISENPYVSRQVLITFSDRVNWKVASSNPAVSTRFIIQHAFDYDWHWGYLGVMDNPTLSNVCIADIVRLNLVSMDDIPIIPEENEMIRIGRTIERTVRLKRDLMEKCWETKRILSWCMSVDELADM